MERVAKQSPGMNSMLRTTCVATQLEGGHAPNTLPQLAAANINCRISPDDTVEHLATLKQVAADDQVIVSIKTNEGKAHAGVRRSRLYFLRRPFKEPIGRH
jgi:acetylornithine deacetylase/succinyl-diaminopimelate desuccinylase-like protein